MATLTERWRLRFPIFVFMVMAVGFNAESAVNSNDEYESPSPLNEMVAISPMVSPLISPLEPIPSLSAPTKEDYEYVRILGADDEDQPQVYVDSDDILATWASSPEQRCEIPADVSATYGDGCSATQNSTTNITTVDHGCIFDAWCSFGFLDYPHWRCLSGIVVENGSEKPKPLVCHTACAMLNDTEQMNVEQKTTECNDTTKPGNYHDHCILELSCNDGYESVNNITKQQLNCSNSEWVTPGTSFRPPRLQCVNEKRKCKLPDADSLGIQINSSCPLETSTTNITSGCSLDIKCKEGLLSNETLPTKIQCLDGNWTDPETGNAVPVPACYASCPNIPAIDHRAVNWSSGCDVISNRRPIGCAVTLSCTEGTQPNPLVNDNQILKCEDGNWTTENHTAIDPFVCEFPPVGCSLNSTDGMTILNETDCSSDHDNIEHQCALTYSCSDKPTRMMTKTCVNGTWQDGQHQPTTPPMCNVTCPSPLRENVNVHPNCDINDDGSFPQNCKIQLECIGGTLPDKETPFAFPHLQCQDGKWVEVLNQNETVTDFLSCHYPEKKCYLDSRGDVVVIDQVGCNEVVHEVDSGCRMNYSCPMTPSIVEAFRCRNGTWVDVNDEESLMGPQCPQSCPALSNLHGSVSSSTDCTPYRDGSYSDRCSAVVSCPAGRTPVAPFSDRQEVYCNRTHWMDPKTGQLDPTFLICEEVKGSCPVDTANGMKANRSANCNELDNMVSPGCVFAYTCPTSTNNWSELRCDAGKWYSRHNTTESAPSCPLLCHLVTPPGVQITQRSCPHLPINDSFIEGCQLQLNCLTGYKPMNSLHGSQAFGCSHGEWKTFRGEDPEILQCSEMGNPCPLNRTVVGVQEKKYCGDNETFVDSGCQLNFTCQHENPAVAVFGQCENGKWLDADGQRMEPPCTPSTLKQCSVDDGLNVTTNQNGCQPIENKIAAHCEVGIKCGTVREREQWKCSEGQWINPNGGHNLDLLKCPNNTVIANETQIGCEYHPTSGVEITTLSCADHNNTYPSGCVLILRCDAGYHSTEPDQVLVCKDGLWQTADSERTVATHFHECNNSSLQLTVSADRQLMAVSSAGCLAPDPNIYYSIAKDPNCMPNENSIINSDCLVDISCLNDPNQIHHLYCGKTQWKSATGKKEALMEFPVCLGSCKSFWPEKYVDIRTLNKNECKRLDGGSATAGCEIEVQCTPGHRVMPAYKGAYPLILHCDGENWRDTEGGAVYVLFECMA